MIRHVCMLLVLYYHVKFDDLARLFVLTSIETCFRLGMCAAFTLLLLNGRVIRMLY